MQAEKAAVAGGKPAKTKPYAKQPRYGEEELAELKEAIAQGTLFYAQGKKVKTLEKEFAARRWFFSSWEWRDFRCCRSAPARRCHWRSILSRRH